MSPKTLSTNYGAVELLREQRKETQKLIATPYLVPTYIPIYIELEKRETDFRDT